MRQVIYTSKAVHPFSELELRDLLGVARRKNAAADVTGMLLYHDGTFIQALEGPVANVEKVFARIQKDERHHDVKVLLKAEVSARDFSNWSMGFLSVNRQILGQLPGYRDVFVQGFDKADSGGLAQKLLREFREEQWQKAVDG